MLKDTLEPPWIFTGIPGKAFAAVKEASKIGDGDHTVETSTPTSLSPDGVYLLHYPFRSFRNFVAKIELAESDFRSNPDLPPTYGWQLRRWLRLGSPRASPRRGLSQFVPDEDVPRLLAGGTLTRDHSIVSTHRRP